MRETCEVKGKTCGVGSRVIVYNSIQSGPPREAIIKSIARGKNINTLIFNGKCERTGKALVFAPSKIFKVLD